MSVVANTGAYGVHGFTVQSVTGLRGLSSYNCPAKRYRCDVVYTNRLVAGAMRGYGAPQGVFALESPHGRHRPGPGHRPGRAAPHATGSGSATRFDIAPRLGERGGVDDVAPEDLPRITSCGTEECVAQALRAIGWDRRHDPAWKRPPDRPSIRRGIGFALCVMGSGIPFVDMGAASIKINDDGSFNLLIGGTDLGTGADTVVAQIAAEVLGVPVDDIIVYAADTDLTPFDVGAYASGTTYITGMAVKQAAEAARAPDRAAGRADARPRRVGSDRAARPPGVGSRRPVGLAGGPGAARAARRGPGADHGHGVAPGPRVPVAVRRPARRGRGGRRHGPGHRRPSS